MSWAQFCLCQGKPVTIVCSKSEGQVVHTALQLFGRDYQAVFSDSILFSTTDGEIIVATLDNNSIWKTDGVDVGLLKDKKQSFLLKVLSNGKLLILGSDAHGAAYGLMELSRLIGISPWEWWADVVPLRRETFELPAGYVNYQSPSVEFRGIFINDEDWGLMPWSSFIMNIGIRQDVLVHVQMRGYLNLCFAYVPTIIGRLCMNVPNLSF